MASGSVKLIKAASPVFHCYVFGTEIVRIQKKFHMKYMLLLLGTALLMACTVQNKSEYQTIEYEAGACFGFCPIFKMTINPDRTAVLEAEHFNFSDGRSKDEFSMPREGTFKGTIKEEDYRTLVEMLNALKPKTLKDKYGSRNVTDLPTSYLRLNFKDGSSKVVEDYGKQGTPDLEKLYRYFEDLRHNQIWEKVGE